MSILIDCLFDSYENEISWLELFIQNKVTQNQFVTDIQNITYWIWY